MIISSFRQNNNAKYKSLSNTHRYRYIFYFGAKKNDDAYAFMLSADCLTFDAYAKSHAKRTVT